MENRGIGTVTLIVIAIITAAVGAGGYLLLGREGSGGGPSGLSKYPGSQSYTIPEEYFGEFGLPEGVEMTAYLSDDTVQEILDWYKGRMTGWTLENEFTDSYMGMTMGVLLYKKGDEGAGIFAMSGMSTMDPSIPEGTIYVLVSGPFSIFESS